MLLSVLLEESVDADVLPVFLLEVLESVLFVVLDISKFLLLSVEVFKGLVLLPLSIVVEL